MLVTSEWRIESRQLKNVMLLDMLIIDVECLLSIYYDRCPVKKIFGAQRILVTCIYVIVGVDMSNPETKISSSKECRKLSANIRR